MRSILLVVVAAASLQAEGEMPKVAVCLDYQGAEFKAAHKARWVTWAIYKRIGVKIEWSICNQKLTEDVRIRFIHSTPADVPPNVLAYALPYEGKTIAIYFDRVRNVSQSFLGDMLGHIMAHEIGHVLQGVARHSEVGVLKANWSAVEKDQMSAGLLQFTPHDADLIHGGISRRASKRAPPVVASNRGR